MKVYIVEENYYCSFTESTQSIIKDIYVNESDADKAIELLKSQNKNGRIYERELKESIKSYPITQFQIGLYTAYSDDGNELSMDDYYTLKEFKFNSSNKASVKFFEGDYEDANFSSFGYVDKYVVVDVPSNDEVKITKVKGLIMELVYEFTKIIEDGDFVTQDMFDELLEKINKTLH